VPATDDQDITNAAIASQVKDNDDSEPELITKETVLATPI